MRKLVLVSLEIDQFQMFDHRLIEFSPALTEISGDNGSGKTTIYSALTWLMFGKDCYGREKFDIKRLVNGVKQDHVDVSVTGRFRYDCDGERSTLMLRRVLTETYDKLGAYKGDQTLCYVNDVPKLVGDYQKFISDIIEESEFRMLTSVTYFLSLPMEEQRDYLCRMAGVRSLEDIVSGNDAWCKAVSQIPKGTSMDEYIKSVKATVRKLDQDLDTIRPSINALVKSKPEERDWAALEDARDMRKVDIDDVNKEISSIEDRDKASVRARVEKFNMVKDKEAEIARLEREARKAVDDAKDEQLKKYADANRLYTECAERNKALAGRAATEERELKYYGTKVHDIETEIDSLAMNLERKMSEKYQRVESRICPINRKACYSEEVQAMFYKEQDRLEEEFNTARILEVKRMKEKGRALTAQLEEAQRKYDDCEAALSGTRRQQEQEAERLGGLRLYGRDDMTVDTGPINSAYKEKEERLSMELNALRKEYEEMTESRTDTSGLMAKRKELMEDYENMVTLLAERKQIEKIDNQISELTQKGVDIADEITQKRILLDMLTAIRRAQIEDAANRINKMFQVTHWQTSVQQKNGDYKDVCYATVDGVSASLNTAARINVGADICEAISNYKGVKVPLFLDNRESVNTLVNITTQLITLTVAPKGTPLTITT